MKASGVISLVAVAVGLAMALACDHQSSVPVVAPEAVPMPDEARLPFDREAQPGGISPTSSVVPAGAQIPAGMLVMIRLQTVLSSATARSEDTFKAVLDEPIVVNDQTLAERGTVVIGRVVEARPMDQMQTPGYLRLTLSSMSINGKSARISTSSNFLKGAGPPRRNVTLPGVGDGSTLVGALATSRGPLLGNAMASDTGPAPSFVMRARDVTVGLDRRLTFRLLEPLPLNP
jgi:hypothetical protein